MRIFQKFVKNRKKYVEFARQQEQDEIKML